MDFSLLDPVIKPILIYLGALGVVRLVGKRALGEISLFDLVIMAMIGDVITVVGLEQEVSVWRGLFFLGVLGGMEIILSLLVFRYQGWAKVFEGSPSLLIRNGLISRKSLRQENISVEDLRQELRNHGIEDISRVERAYLESSGRFSVILNPSDPEKRGDPRIEEILMELRALKEMLKNKE